MKQAFYIAIQYAHDQEVNFLLEQDGNGEQKIRLGSTIFSLGYSGDDMTKVSVIEKLEETFVNHDLPVTKENLKHCLESIGVVAVSTRIEKLQRAYKRAAVIGKGMQAMSRRTSIDEAQGRIMQETVYKNLYLEVSFNEEDVYANQKEVLFRCWKLDKKTLLSLPEWEGFKRRQWEKSGTDGEFLPWLYHKYWMQSGTKEDMFTWFLRQEHEKLKVQMPFDKWKAAIISELSKYYGKYFDKTTTKSEILETWLDTRLSGSNLSDKDYIEFSKWKKSNRTDAFSDVMIRNEWKRTDKSETLKDYTEFKLQSLRQRWESSGLKQAGLDFDAWRNMQDPTFVNDLGLRPFIRCDAETRKLFQLSSSPSGMILRNHQPYSTEYESTLHSGKGYAIFVVGPDEKIYAATHIQQVFHHSSFLANGAVLAAGELRMGLDCSIQYAKDKHQVKAMQEQFTSKNIDPYKMQFIKNEQENVWLLAGENTHGHMQVIQVPARSALEKALPGNSQEEISFSKRPDILNAAANLLGRTNPIKKVTMLSSKSGHYQPRDEENYFMLKLWEKYGVDLSITPFVQLGTSKTYKCAKEYLQQIEPRMEERRKTRLYMESGGVQNHLRESMYSTRKTILINEKGDCFEGGLSHPAFAHEDVIKAIKLPGFKEGTFVFKQDVKKHVEKLNAKVQHDIVRVEALDKLIKKSSKRMRARRGSRQLHKKNIQARILRMSQDIETLEKAMHSTPSPGVQLIRGGGTISLNAVGEVTEIDAKLGNHVLSDMEIKKTLLTLKQRGVYLEAVSLITYDEKGSTITQNANQYLVQRQQLKSHKDQKKSKGSENSWNTPIDIAHKHSKDGRATGSDKVIQSLNTNIPKPTPLVIKISIRKLFKMSQHKADELLSLPMQKREYSICKEGTLYLADDVVDNLHKILQSTKGNEELISVFEEELKTITDELERGIGTGEVFDHEDEFIAKCFNNAKEQIHPVMNKLLEMKKDAVENTTEVHYQLIEL